MTPRKSAAKDPEEAARRMREAAMARALKRIERMREPRWSISRVGIDRRAALREYPQTRDALIQANGLLTLLGVAQLTEAVLCAHPAEMEARFVDLVIAFQSAWPELEKVVKIEDGLDERMRAWLVELLGYARESLCAGASYGRAFADMLFGASAAKSASVAVATFAEIARAAEAEVRSKSKKSASMRDPPPLESFHSCEEEEEVIVRDLPDLELLLGIDPLIDYSATAPPPPCGVDFGQMAPAMQSAVVAAYLRMPDVVSPVVVEEEEEQTPASPSPPPPPKRARLGPITSWWRAHDERMAAMAAMIEAEAEAGAAVAHSVVF